MSSNNPSQDTENTEEKAAEEAQGSSESVDREERGQAETNGGEDATPAREAATSKDRIAELQARADENWDRFLRANAELENVRKRVQRDVQNAHKYGLEKFAAALLDVCDSMEQGLERARRAAEDAGEVVDPLVEGMELTARQLSDVLKRFNVERIDAQGAAFDPELHEAMTTRPTAEQPPNTVVEVMRPGYRLNDRLLRPAMVIVSKAPDENVAKGSEEAGHDGEPGG